MSSVANALGLALALALAGCTRETPEAQNLQLAEEVREELESEGLATHVSVTAMDGVVTLSGHVFTASDRSRAELASRGVEGVDDVRNQLEVGLDAPVAAPPPAANPPNE